MITIRNKCLKKHKIMCSIIYTRLSKIKEKQETPMTLTMKGKRMNVLLDQIQSNNRIIRSNKNKHARAQ